MRILQTQLDELARKNQAHFREAMRVDIRERYPEKTSAMSDDEIRARIDEGMQASRGYGIDTENDVRAYIYLMFELGFDFDREVAWARDILNREGWNGSIRIDLLRAAHEGRIPGPEGGLFFPSA